MKKTQKSQTRTKFLFILIILTAILSITATYAWFSSQRDVEITGMRLNVEIAENMQISLDGETWAQSITIADMRQFYGTYAGAGDDFKVYQAKKPDDGGNTNYVPKELLPVSTIGEVSSGTMQFVTGEVKTEATGVLYMEDVALCDESDITATETIGNRELGNSDHPYLIFDMYLRNVSAQTSDALLLNTGSKVWVTASTNPSSGGYATTQEGTGKEGTGLEYSVRVGFIPYTATADLTATGDTVRGLAAGAATGEKAAIWEPNPLEHTNEVVKNNQRGIASTSQFVTTYGVKAAADGNDIDDVNADASAAGYSGHLATQTTFYAGEGKYTVTGGTTETLAVKYTDGTAVTLQPNKITKIRCYIWLEGQDPDCINTASTGDRLFATIRLTKPVIDDDSDGNTYAN